MTQYKFSLITPSYKYSSYLDELYESIKNQTYKNWEWILYLNNDFSPEQVPKNILSDPRVIIYRDDSNNSCVGYVKKNAFSLGTGDILVEVDHDDILVETCLEKLNEAFQNQEIGFVYSDDAMWHHEDNFSPFDHNQGWTYKEFEWKGKKLISMNSFKPSSHSLSFIWYAPDHVRAWRKTVYDQIGGHNEELDICDDHELLIRTYIHTKFHHIPEVLYIYRITGWNTWASDEKNEKIQILTRELFNQYAQRLAERDADLKGLKKIDIGGGLNGFPDYLTIDQEGGDITCDLNEGIPLPDNSVGVINASHVIEHLRDPFKTMSEIHRVLAHGGWVFIEVPSTDGRGAFQDPTHVSFWNENSFMYYTDSNLAYFIRNNKVRFQPYRCETHYPNEWMKNIDVPVVSAWMFAIKDDNIRFPGILNI
jgi:O-antigen biosynthesis protein